jgi:hypothetical protein
MPSAIMIRVIMLNVVAPLKQYVSAKCHLAKWHLMYWPNVIWPNGIQCVEQILFGQIAFNVLAKCMLTKCHLAKWYLMCQTNACWPNVIWSNGVQCVDQMPIGQVAFNQKSRKSFITCFLWCQQHVRMSCLLHITCRLYTCKNTFTVNYYNYSSVYLPRVKGYYDTDWLCTS